MNLELKCMQLLGVAQMMRKSWEESLFWENLVVKMAEVSRTHVAYRYYKKASVHQRRGTVQRCKRKESLGERSNACNSNCLWFPLSRSFYCLAPVAWLGYLSWIPTCPFPCAAQAQERGRRYPPVEPIFSAFQCLKPLNMVLQALSISNSPQGRK